MGKRLDNLVSIEAQLSKLKRQLDEYEMNLNLANVKNVLRIELERVLRLLGEFAPFKDVVNSYLQGYGRKDIETTKTFLETQLSKIDSALYFYDDLKKQMASENELNIKLLDEMTFDELNTILDDLNFIFNQCPLIRKANDNNDVKITGVESGSIWFYLGIASVALPIIGSIMGLTFKFLHNILFLRRQVEGFKAQKNGNEMAEAVAKVITAQANMLATQFNSEENHSLDFEDVAKLAKTIELLGGLVERNIVFQPSIAAPKEVQDKFPKLEEYKEIVQLLGGPKPIAALKQANDE